MQIITTPVYRLSISFQNKMMTVDKKPSQPYTWMLGFIFLVSHKNEIHRILTATRTMWLGKEALAPVSLNQKVFSSDCTHGKIKETMKDML